MKRFQLFMVTLLLMLATAVAAQEAAVKVIALFSNKALLQVGDQQKIVSKGETFQGVFLQSATGRGAVVVINGETVKLSMNQTISGNYKKRERTRLRIVPDARGMYFVTGTINNQSTSFLVDTGATYVTMSGTKAKALKIDFKKGVPGHAQTASAVVPVWQIRLASVSIGAIKIRNVTATVIEGNQPFEVLLGNSFLSRTEIHRSDKVLEITQRH
jgi:aspartyl protease family protein